MECTARGLGNGLVWQGKGGRGEGAASNRASILARAGGQDNAESRVCMSHATGS